MANTNFTGNFMESPLFRNVSSVHEVIKVDDIVRLYQYKLGIDVSHLFGSHTTIKLMSSEESGLFYFEPCIAGDPMFYSSLQEVEHYYMTYRPEFITAKKYIGKGSVLEIGCGIGLFSQYIDQSIYRGLELNKKAVAQALLNGLDVREQLIEEYIAITDEEMDVVCSFQVLEHVEDIDGFIRSSICACKDGGYIIYSLPAEDSFMKKARNQPLNLPPHHASLWTDKVFYYIARQYDLELVELKHEPMEEIHKLWFFKVVFGSFFDKMLKRKNQARIDLSLSVKCLEKISSLLAWMMTKIFVADEFYPSGHTVTAVFRKRAQHIL